MEIDIYKLGEKYNLTHSEELALRYIVNNIDTALDVGVRGIAKECFASTSVVMNLSKKLGYKGFVDMVYRLERIFFDSPIKKIEVEEYCTNFSPEKMKIFKNLLLKSSKSPIFINGVGFSECVAKYIKNKLMILGYYAMMSEFMENVERYYDETPLLIVVSKTGETSAVLNLCEKAAAKNVPIIVFTGMKESTMEKIGILTFHIKHINMIDDRNIEENDFFGNTILFFEKLISKTKMRK